MEDKAITLSIKELAYLWVLSQNRFLSAMAGTLEEAKSLDEFKEILIATLRHAQFLNFTSLIFVGEEKATEIREALNNALIQVLEIAEPTQGLF